MERTGHIDMVKEKRRRTELVVRRWCFGVLSWVSTEDSREREVERKEVD
jgi:hypothetical protein